MQLAGAGQVLAADRPGPLRDRALYGDQPERPASARLRGEVGVKSSLVLAE